MHQVVLSSRLNSLDHPRLLTSSHARIRVWFWDPHCRLLWIHKRHVFVPIWSDCLSVILDLIVLTGWNHSHMEIVMLPLWAGQGDQRPQLCSWPIKQTESTRNAQCSVGALRFKRQMTASGPALDSLGRGSVKMWTDATDELICSGNQEIFWTDGLVTGFNAIGTIPYL